MIDTKAFLKIEPVWGKQKTEALKLMYELGDQERKERIEKILTVSLKQHLNDSLLGNQVLLPPSPDEACRGKQEIFAGSVCYGFDRGGNHTERYPLYLNYEDIKNHILITGLSGVGKTVAAMNLVTQLARNDQSVIIFDWDRQWRNLKSLDENFAKDIRVYTIGRNEISGFSWNFIFSKPEGVRFSNWMQIAVSTPLERSLMAGHGVTNVLGDEAEKVMAAYQEGMLKLLPNIEDIGNRLRHKFSKGREMLWQQSSERIIKELSRDSVKELFGSRDPIDIGKEILMRKGITILELDAETPYHLRVLFKDMFTMYTLLYYLHLGEAGKEELRALLVGEEFQNMLDQTHEKRTGSDVLSTLLREGRKMGLGTLSILQESSMCPNWLQANCLIQLIFAAQTAKDIHSAASGLFLSQDEIKFLDYIWRGECIAKVKGRVKNCLLKIPPPPPLRNITDEELKEDRRQWSIQK